jgi:DNA-binding beta-propeller fold protein YncE
MFDSEGITHMRRMLKNLIVLALLLASTAAGGEVTFTRKPTAKKNGAKTVIEFAVTRKTDVAVYIENNAGKVVRHLVAGVLGSKSPAPLKPGLSQSLEWDGKDDYGKKAVGGPFKVRVALGLKPTFDGFLLGKPQSTGRIDAIAVGPKGRLFVFHKDEGLVHWGSHKVKILDREGKHLKAIWPYPADIDPKRVKALAPHQTKDGDLVPRIYQALKFSFYPEHHILGLGRHCGSTSPAVGADGRLYWMGFGLRLGCLDADGGVPYETLLGPKLLTNVKGLTAANPWKSGSNCPSLAVSGDGKHVYFAGLRTLIGKTGAWLPCVYRVDLKTRGPATVFVGKPGSPGKEKGLLTAPRGLAVANGHLYVGDPGANRVVVFKEAGGAYVGEIKVKGPHSIGVDPGTGAVYVASYTGIRTAELIKFNGYKNAKALYKGALPRTGMNPNPGACRIAVDASAKPAGGEQRRTVRIWVPSTGNWGQLQATRIDDTGKAFQNKKLPRDGGGIYRDLTYDRRRGELYVKHGGDWLRIDEKTGKVKKRLKLKNGIGTQLVAAPDGSLVTLGHWSGSGLIRFDRDGKPLNWPGLKTSRIPYHGIMNFMERVLAVKSLNEIYVILPPKYLTNRKNFAVGGGARNTVDVLGADGKPKRTAVWQCTHGAILRVDHKGNIYLADMVTPPGRAWPEFFDGKLTPVAKRGRQPADRQWLSYLYGSIVKFPPSGGAIWYAGQKGHSSSCVGKPSKAFLASPSIKVGAHKAYAKGKAELQGAAWYRFGFAPFGIHNTSGNCSCEGAGFDVDMFGRVFYPNVGQFRVEVVDPANNMIGTFGKYGNQDSGGKDAAVKKPKIPFAWPLTVVTSDTHAYVADSINRRIVKVKLGYRAEASCEVR